MTTTLKTKPDEDGVFIVTRDGVDYTGVIPKGMETRVDECIQAYAAGLEVFDGGYSGPTVLDKDTQQQVSVVPAERKEPVGESVVEVDDTIVGESETVEGELPPGPK